MAETSRKECWRRIFLQARGRRGDRLKERSETERRHTKRPPNIRIAAEPATGSRRHPRLFRSGMTLHAAVCNHRACGTSEPAGDEYGSGRKGEHERMAAMTLPSSPPLLPRIINQPIHLSSTVRLRGESLIRLSIQPLLQWNSAPAEFTRSIGRGAQIDVPSGVR
jgi:hypothetical protein